MQIQQKAGKKNETTKKQKMRKESALGLLEKRGEEKAHTPGGEKETEPASKGRRESTFQPVVSNENRPVKLGGGRVSLNSIGGGTEA